MSRPKIHDLDCPELGGPEATETGAAMRHMTEPGARLPGNHENQQIFDKIGHNSETVRSQRLPPGLSILI